MKKVLVSFFALVIILALAVPAFSHCQIPCGIYDDKARIDMLSEDIRTVEKAMKLIAKLSAEKPVNYNQVVRWVDAKEHHAGKIQRIIFEYFMTQRIKPVAPTDSAYNKYVKELTLLHQMAVYAMKAKQTTDVAWCSKFRAALQEFAKSYFSGQKK